MLWRYLGALLVTARASCTGPLRQHCQATGDIRMKLPWIWRRRSATAPARAPEPDISPIDVTIERACVYQAFEGHPGPCPRCGEPLRQNYQSYVRFLPELKLLGFHP